VAAEKRLKEAEASANLAAAQAAKYDASAATSGAAEDVTRQWSCEADDGFVPYAEEDNAAINLAFNPFNPESSDPVYWSERGYDYEINWEFFAQVNLQTGSSRMIRFEKAPKRAPGMTLLPAGAKPWSIPAQSLSNGTVLYSIKASSLDSRDTREQAEFNFAYGQMLRLAENSRTYHVTQVDFYESPLVKAKYESKKKSMPHSNEFWVFHGTKTEDAKNAIMTGGFKVGGQDTRVPIVNGKVHGNGVYTATGPNTPMTSYSGESKRVILAKALEGTRGTQGASDCWAPRGDWLVFRTGEQLLPTYVVHWA